MNKTLKAWLSGYVSFEVNGSRFYRYNTAKRHFDSIPKEESAGFSGFSLLRGREYFKVRVAQVTAPGFEQVDTSEEVDRARKYYKADAEL